MAHGVLLVILQGDVRGGGVAQSEAFESLLWFGAVLLIVVVAVVLLIRVRRFCLRGDRGTPAGLDLDELRRQRDRGTITIAEYETLRKIVLRSFAENESPDAKS